LHGWESLKGLVVKPASVPVPAKTPAQKGTP
jgi:hypothetical protein